MTAQHTSTQTIAPSADYKSVDPDVATCELDTSGFTSLRVGINVTAASGGGGVTVTIEGHDEASDTWFTLLASTLLATTGFRTLLVDPRIAASANAIAQLPLPARVRIKPVGSGTRTTLTYSISADMSK